MNATLTMTVDEAVAALADFRRRPAAIRNLQAHGTTALPRLRTLMDAPNTAVAWCAIRLVGDLGDKDSIPKLRELAQNPEYASACADALEKLGTPLETSESAISAGRPGKTTQSTYTDDELLKLAIANRSGVEYRKIDDGYRVSVRTSNGPQDVIVKFPADFDGDSAVTVYADLGIPIDAAFYERVLRLNTRLPEGAVGIDRIDGQDRFVMTDTHLRATFDPPELAKSIFGVARLARRIAGRIRDMQSGSSSSTPSAPTTGSESKS